MVLIHTINEYQKWDAELCLFTLKMSDLTPGMDLMSISDHSSVFIV